MRVIDDVFEAPSGPQRRIQYLKFSRPNEDRDDPYVSFLNADGSGWTTREDWGLEFRKDEVSSSGIHLRCKQVGGQQMGELSLTMCYINNEDETKQWQVSDFVEIPIARNAWTDIRLDWTEAVGQLPPGNYTFLVNVDDQLNMRDETLVHLYQNPLMRNFWGNQWYEVSFTVD